MARVDPAGEQLNRIFEVDPTWIFNTAATYVESVRLMGMEVEVKMDVEERK